MSAFGQEEACHTKCLCYKCRSTNKGIDCNPCITCIGVHVSEITEDDSGSWGYLSFDDGCEKKDKFEKELKGNEG